MDMNINNLYIFNFIAVHLYGYIVDNTSTFQPGTFLGIKARPQIDVCPRSALQQFLGINFTFNGGKHIINESQYLY